jgi:hypothetical protein
MATCIAIVNAHIAIDLSQPQASTGLADVVGAEAERGSGGNEARPATCR